MDREGATALFVAAQEGHAETCRELCRVGANPDLPRKGGISPLFVATAANHIGVVKTLVFCKADCNQASQERGLTPLHVACQLGHIEIIRALLAHASPHALTTESLSPLFFAAAHNNVQAVAALLAGRANPNGATTEADSPMQGACANGFTQVVSALIDAKASLEPRSEVQTAGPNVRGPFTLCVLHQVECAPLYMACQNGHTELVAELLRRHTESSGHLLDLDQVTV